MDVVKEIVNEIDRIWTKLVDNGYFTEDELQLVTDIAGYSVETLNDCIYSRYGYRSLEQLEEEW